MQLLPVHESPQVNGLGENQVKKIVQVVGKLYLCVSVTIMWFLGHDMITSVLTLYQPIRWKQSINAPVEGTGEMGFGCVFHNSPPPIVQAPDREQGHHPFHIT